MELKNIGYLASIIMNLVVLFIIAYQMRIKKVKTLKYFFIAFLILLMGDSLIFSISSDIIEGSNAELFLGIIELSFTCLALYFILIFIETFKTEHPFRKWTGLLGLVCVFVTTISFISGLNLVLINSGSNEFSFNVDSPSPILKYLFIIEFSIGSILTLLLNLALLFIIVRKLWRQMKIVKYPYFKKILQKMFYGLGIIVFGTILAAIEFIPELMIISVLGSVISFAGFVYLLLIYLIRGIHVLQAEKLHNIFIFDQAGIPVYSYKFTFASESTEARSANDMLISGALKAIFLLLTDLTGVDQVVKEIILDNSSLLIQSSPDKKYAVVLLLEESSKFYRTALSEFTTEFFNSDIHFLPNQRLTESNLKIADQKIEQFFGFRKK